MNIINSSLPFPRLSKSNVNFNSIDADGSCGDMSVRFHLITDDVRFNELIEFLHDKIRNEYYNPWNELEPEFEQSLNRDIDFVITMNNYGNYEFNLFAHGGEDTYMNVQVDLCDDEIELFKPYMYKYFEPSYQLEQLRKESVQTINTVIPKQIREKFKLIADRLDGVRYRSSWMSYDNQQSIVCEWLDYTNSQCPITIAKFGF